MILLLKYAGIVSVKMHNQLFKRDKAALAVLAQLDILVRNIIIFSGSYSGIYMVEQF
jgi:hypothetical protein